MKLKHLRPKKCYGKALWRNKEAIRDMQERYARGETYQQIAESYGVTQPHAWLTLNKLIKIHADSYTRN